MIELQRSLGIIEGYLLSLAIPLPVMAALAVVKCHCDTLAPLGAAPPTITVEKKKNKAWSEEAKEKRKKALKAKLATGWRPGMKNSEIPESQEQNDSDEEEMFEPEPDEGNP